MTLYTTTSIAKESEQLYATLKYSLLMKKNASGILGTDTPTKLQRAVFFTVGKGFCVRGVKEQRTIGPSQFRRDPNCYVYIKHGLKNRAGGLARRKQVCTMFGCARDA